MPIETPLGPLQTLDDVTAAATADRGVAERVSCPVLVLIAPVELWARNTTTDVRGMAARPGITMLPPFVVRVTGAAGGQVKRPLVMGRGEECDIQLAFSALSKKHATFIPNRHDDQWQLEDIGSRNGIFVDGTRLASNRPSPLPDGAKVRFGNVVGRFMLPAKFRAELLGRIKK